MFSLQVLCRIFIHLVLLDIDHIESHYQPFQDANIQHRCVNYAQECPACSIFVFATRDIVLFSLSRRCIGGVR